MRLSTEGANTNFDYGGAKGRFGSDLKVRFLIDRFQLTGPKVGEGWRTLGWGLYIYIYGFGRLSRIVDLNGFGCGYETQRDSETHYA
jgi:hypothetical protein